MTEGSISGSEGRTEGEKRGAGAEETSEKEKEEESQERTEGRVSIAGFPEKKLLLPGREGNRPGLRPRGRETRRSA